MKKLREYRHFLVIAVFLISCISSRYGKFDAYLSSFGGESETHVMRAIDSVPPAIPAIKETSKRASVNFALTEELLFALCVCAAVSLRKLSEARTEWTVPACSPLTKYIKSIIARQTVK